MVSQGSVKWFHGDERSFVPTGISGDTDTSTFEERIAEIKEGNERRSREALIAKVYPELSDRAITSMAIYSAQESAS